MTSSPPSSPTPNDATERPAVILWYKVYAGFLVLLAVATTVMGGLMLRSSRWFHGNETLMMTLGAVVLLSGLATGIVSCASLFFPRKKWAHIAHIAIMVMSMSILVVVPICIPLLLRYNKPDIKDWYSAGG